MSQEHSGARHVDRREYLELTGGLVAAGTVGFAGCTSADPTEDASGPTATGYLATEVTDQPTDIDDFESCVVTIEGIWLGPRSDGAGEDGDEEGDEDDADEEGEEDEEGESTSQAVGSGSQPEGEGQGANQTTPGSGDEDEESEDGNDADEGGEDGDDADEGDEDGDDADEGDGDDGASGGRTYLAFDEPGEADLVELQDDSTQLIDDREVDVGTYRFLQLDVGGVDGVLTDGSEATVETPGNAPLKFQASFEVREDTRTTFTADFAPVRRGSGEYLIRPVASGTTVSYESVGDGE